MPRLALLRRAEPEGAPARRPAADTSGVQSPSSAAPFKKVTAFLLVLAAVAFASQATISFNTEPGAVLLAGAGALALAALTIVARELKTLIAPLVVVEAVAAVALTAASYGLTRSQLPVEILTLGFIWTVLLSVLLAPASRAMPLATALVLLAGYAWAVGFAGSVLLVGSVALAAMLASLASSKVARLCERLRAENLDLAVAASRLEAQSAASKESGEVAAAVLEAANSFTAALQPAAIADQICRGTTNQLRAAGTVLLLWDQELETFRIGAIQGLGGPAGSELRQVEVRPDSLPVLQPGLPSEVVKLQPNSVREPMLRSLFQRWRAASVLGVRLQRGDQLLGLLLAARSDRQGHFSRRDFRLLSGIAVHAAAALAHADLIADLQSTNQLKEEFMATMSHELRTPLNVIIGYTDLQIEGAFGELEEEHTATLRTVREQSLQLLQLIQATLDMSRLERGLVTVDLCDVAIPQFMEQLQVQIPPSWRKPTVDLSWRIEPQLPPIRTDPSKLQILLRNLVHNALKFTHHGMVTVSATASPATGHVTFVVQDSGCGIKAAHLSEIFEMFRQTPTGEDNPGGVGLGLYIVKRLAGVLAAEIEVSSAPGRGATFRIHLPVGGPLAVRRLADR